MRQVDKRRPARRALPHVVREVLRHGACALAMSASLLHAPRLHAQASPTPPSTSQTPAEIERLVLERTPELRAQQARVQASLERAAAMRQAWPQPHFDYSATLDAPWLMEPGIKHMAMVAQMIPLPGMLEREGRVMDVMARVDAAMLEGERLAMLTATRVMFIEYARMGEMARLVAEQRKLHAQVRAIVEVTSPTQGADIASIVQLSLAEELLADRETSLEAQLGRELERLASMAGLDPSVPLRVNLGEAQNPLATPRELPEWSALVPMVCPPEHPEVLRLEALGQGATARMATLRDQKFGMPEVRLGIESMPEMMTGERRTALVAGVAVNIPWFVERFSLERRALEQDRAAARADREGRCRSMRADAREAWSRIGEALGRLARYERDLMPLSAESARQLLARVEVGEMSVVEYLFAVGQQLELAMTVVDLKATVALERNRLEQLTASAFVAFPAREAASWRLERAGTGEVRREEK